MQVISKLMILICVVFCLTSCFGVNKYGFVNEINGAYTIAQDIITPSKATTDCDSLSKSKKKKCLKKSKELLKAINRHSN